MRIIVLASVLIPATVLIFASCGGTTDRDLDVREATSITPVSVLTWMPIRYRHEPDADGMEIIRAMEQVTGIRFDVQTMNSSFGPDEAIRYLIQTIDAPDTPAPAIPRPDIVLLPGIDVLTMYYLQPFARGSMALATTRTAQNLPLLEWALLKNDTRVLEQELPVFAPIFYRLLSDSYRNALEIEERIVLIPLGRPERPELIWLIRNDRLEEAGLGAISNYVELAEFWNRAYRLHPEEPVLFDSASTRYTVSLQWIVKRHLWNTEKIRFIDIGEGDARFPCFYFSDNDGVVHSLLEQPADAFFDIVRATAQASREGPVISSGTFFRRDITDIFIAAGRKDEKGWSSIGISVNPEAYTLQSEGYEDTFLTILTTMLESGDYSIYVPWSGAAPPIVAAERYPSFAFTRHAKPETRAAVLAALDRMYTQDFYDLYTFGIEGNDWKKCPDGSVETVENGTPGSRYSTFYFPLADQTYPASYRRAPAGVPYVYQDILDDYETYLADSDIDILTGFTIDTSQFRHQMTYYTTHIGTKLFRFTTGQDSIDLEWDTFSREHQRTVAIMREEIQKQVDAYLRSRNIGR